MAAGLATDHSISKGVTSRLKSSRGGSFLGLGRRTAVVGSAIVVIVGLSIVSHVVGAIDRTATEPVVASVKLDLDADVPVGFETGGGHGGSSGGEDEIEDDAAVNGDEPLFLEVPDMLVSLDAGKGRSIFVKLRFSLELPDPGDKSIVKKLMPRIVDRCQVYLRELRREDFRGSAGMLRLREELLRRVGHAVAPVQITDVLLTDLVVQ